MPVDDACHRISDTHMDAGPAPRRLRSLIGWAAYCARRLVHSESRSGEHRFPHMATIDGRALDFTSAGGVRFLMRQAEQDWTETLPDGVTVTSGAGSHAAVVHGLHASLAIDDVGPEVDRLVNQALDLMAVRSLGVYSMTEVNSPRVAWTRSNGQLLLRTTSYVHSTFTMTIGGRPNPPPTAWHASMRYFRLSQTTADLFDAFRNLYPVRLRL